jgi:maltodextrin utilization protein YvdJ
MSHLLDTIMNIEVFAFIGLLVWLYFKPRTRDDNERPDKQSSI